jgi:hypothetical protein
MNYPKIILGYDVVTSNGELPNGLNPKYFNTIYESSKFRFRDSEEYFRGKWGVHWPVFIGNHYDQITKRKSIYNIINDRKEGTPYNWYYLVEPYAGLDVFFGNHPNQKDFVLNFISDNAIDEIVNHMGNLLINYVIDGGIGINEENFKKIAKFTRSKKIPDEKVFLIFSDFKLKDNLQRLGINYNFLDYNFYLIFKSLEFGRNMKSARPTITTKEEFIDSIGKPKKDFLHLTGRWKLHRLLILSQLQKLGIDNNLVSWDNRYYDEKLVNDFLKLDNNIEFMEMLKTESKVLDVENIKNVMGYGFENKEMYLNSYISLVTESIFFEEKGKGLINSNFPSGFLSEKIWKPIGHCQPFILIGPAKSLQYIKERYQFKTFHPFIDEDYDNELNDELRLELIQKEIDKFSNKSEDEKIEFLNEVKDICIYNQEKFLSFGFEMDNQVEENPELSFVYEFLQYK